MFASSFGSIEMLEEKMEMSVKELKQEYWETVEEELLVEKYKYVLFGNISVSSQEVLDFYTTYKDSFPPTPDLFSGSIIERPIKISPSSRDSIFNLATAVKDSLVLGLLDFSTAAKKYSQDPGSSSFGGNLGFSKRGSFVSSYEKTAFGLKDGEIGEITETQFGYHIIKLEQRLGEKINTSHILFSLAPSKKDILKTKSKLKDVFLSVEKDPGLMDSLALEAFKEMGVKTFYIGKSLEDPKRATVMFQGPVNTCYDIFVNPETKPIVEASGHIYEGTIINRWISE